MNSGSAGNFTRLNYDNCASQKRLYEETAPLSYQLYQGKFEHCQKCVYDDKNIWRPFDLVDYESELKGITRVASKCSQFKYNPGCKKSGKCTSTFDPSNPIIYAPEICPIIQTNMHPMSTPGYIVPNQAFCGKKRNARAEEY